MYFPVWFKWIAFFIVIFTSLILPIIFLESSFSEYGKTLMEWSEGNSFMISLLVILALTADVFLPVPNGCLLYTSDAADE